MYNVYDKVLDNKLAFENVEIETLKSYVNEQLESEELILMETEEEVLETLKNWNFVVIESVK